MADSIPYTTILERVKKDIDYIAEQACIKGYNLAKEEIALSGEYERAYKRGKEDAERKKGKWIWSDEDASWKCGSCDCVFEEIEWKPEYNFCPNCGADMRGEENERHNIQAGGD